MIASLAASLSPLPAAARVLDFVAAAPAGLKYAAIDFGGMAVLYASQSEVMSSDASLVMSSRVNRGQPPHWLIFFASGGDGGGGGLSADASCDSDNPLGNHVGGVIWGPW